MAKGKVHTQYKLADGTRVPGVSTIKSQLGWNTRVLISWANKIGLEGIEQAKYVDDKAEIGTLAHAIVTDHLLGVKTDTSDYSKNQIDLAENSALSFFSWAKGKTIKPILDKNGEPLIERPLVSELLKFGGTPDLPLFINDVPELIDLKTGKGIYEEFWVQTSAYRVLLEEIGIKVEKVRILNIPRVESEAFLEDSKEKTDIYFEVFKHCFELYKIQKMLGK